MQIRSPESDSMRLSTCVRALLVCALLALQSHAQDTGHRVRIPVKFECNCADEVGQLYATAFRDILASSPRFVSEVGFDNSGGSSSGPPSMRVNVVSVDPFNDGQVTAMSIAFILGSTTYLTHVVRWCPKDRANSCAASTFAELDDQVQKLATLKANDIKTP
jgi:hypothetical protein